MVSKKNFEISHFDMLLCMYDNFGLTSIHFWDENWTLNVNAPPSYCLTLKHYHLNLLNKL